MTTSPSSEWLPPAEWYASLPTVYVAAGGLITDSAGGILLVKPNYRDHWGFPGGIVDFGEPPHEACARELLEELGVSLAVGPLLLTCWAPPVGERPQPMIYLLYDCGVLPSSTEITLQVSELDAYAFLPYADALARLEPMVSGRLPAALEARRTGQAAYLVTAPV